MFFPGETITHIFYIPFAINEVNHVILSYKQNGAIILEKTITSGFEEDSAQSTKFTYALSQNDSLLFEDNSPFTIQCNVYTTGNTRHASHEMNSESGIQYLRDVITPAPMKIINQPTDCTVDHIGDTAFFKVVAQGAARYQWQYRVNQGEWKDASDSHNPAFEVVATQERINTHTYRCIVHDLGIGSITTDVVKIIYIDRSDE